MAGNPTGNQITNEIMYMANLLGRGQMPYAGAFQGVTGALQGAADFLNRNQIGTRGISAQRPPMPGLPADYKQTELAAGAAAERFRPGAGFPGQQAAERAYQSEKAAVAQQVAQDPALSQYDRDRAAAVASGDQAKMDAVRDQGMALWAKANPTLAAKVKPGQSGYDAIQGAMAGQAASQGFGYQMPQQMIFTPPPGVNTPQGLPAVESIGPSATYGAQGIDIDPEMQKKFQELLNQANK
jgi:hypothetical protein